MEIWATNELLYCRTEIDSELAFGFLKMGVSEVRSWVTVGLNSIFGCKKQKKHLFSQLSSDLKNEKILRIWKPCVNFSDFLIES